MPKNIIVIFLALILIAVGITAYFVYTAKEIQIDSKQVEQKEKQNFIGPIASQVNEMSLDQKIGQMLIVGFENKYLDDHIRKMIEQYHIGGINFLSRNVKDRNQIQRLITDLQKTSDIPLFIATDQEGGKFIRFNFLNELTPQIRIKEIQQAERVAFVRAGELREIGVNMNFSPVLDYVSNSKSYLYNRTFGVNPENIGTLGNAMIEGYMRGGIVPVAKHFPGYGNLFLDPHTNQATLNIDYKELKLNLFPFQKVVMNNPATAIMTAHIVIPNVDVKPATLSAKFLSEILRKQMGFRGVIITDDMEMVSAGGSIGQSSVDAVKVGADMIISTYTPEKQIEIFNRFKKAVLDSEITEERINESVIRILILKSTIEKITP